MTGPKPTGGPPNAATDEHSPDRSVEGDLFIDGTAADGDHGPRPAVRWVRHRPLLGPVVRWGTVGFVVLVVMMVAWNRVENWIDAQIRPDGLPGAEVEITIEDGWTTNDVVAALGDADVIDSPAMFRQWMRCPSVLRRFLDCEPGGDYSFMAGQYLLREHLTFDEAVSVLVAGPLPKEVVRVMIPEGLTLEQTVVRLLDRMPAFDEQELRAALLSEQLRWDHYPAELPFLLPEGLLFPETYQLDEATVADELGLVTRMHRQFLKVVEVLDLESRAAAHSLSPYEVVVVASLIEEEALLNEERPKISRVIHNRLERGWRLGIDATARYAVGKIAGEPMSTEDLEVDSPWNTRVVTGLPPTPIAAPGRASLEAALAPADGDWLYYVRTDEGDVVGAHTFAITSHEFNRARQGCIEKDLGCG